ncbi:MAG: HAD family hydrolase, partial [Deltaproteobacteria bacterium]|nr:HAD family hydrolase [Deltaproteobacteria bacterium]
MSNSKIKAVTFDLWDTVFIDETDEPKRKEKGLASKPVERRNLVESYLNRHQPITREEVELAYSVTDAAFRHVWYNQNVTWEIPERLSVLLKGLGRELPEDEFAELVRLHEEMELEISPDIAANIETALSGLSKKYKLGVISDTIFSPGRVLRGILEKHGLLKYFDFFVFSDEAGCAKPNPVMFEKAAKGLGVELNEIVHIGDRREKDIDGPHAVGAKGIYTTVVKDRGVENCNADAVCTDYLDLVSIVDN